MNGDVKVIHLYIRLQRCCSMCVNKTFADNYYTIIVFLVILAFCHFIDLIAFKMLPFELLLVVFSLQCYSRFCKDPWNLSIAKKIKNYSH